MEKINPIGDIYKKDNKAETYYDVVGKSLEDKEYREADKVFNDLMPKDLDNKVVLDLGCGNGLYAEMFCERGAKKVVAIDLNEKMLEKAREKKEEKKLDKLDLVLADMDSLPTNENKFDFIFSRFSLVHTSKLEQVMGDLSRSLKVEGEILIGTNVAVIQDLENNSDIRRKAIPILISINGKEIALEDFSYTLEDYLEAFDKAGLNVVIKEQFPADDVLINPNFPKKDMIKFNYGIFKLRKEK